MSNGREPRAADRRPRLYRLMIMLAAVILLIDQASKEWAISALTGREPVALIPDLIQLRLLYNPGAAFSIGTGATWVFALATAVVVAGTLYVGRRSRSAAWSVVLGGLLGGAASHLIDRFFRDPGFGRGHVVDFIDYGPFVGNVADIALTLSCAALMLLNVRGVPLGEPAGEDGDDKEDRGKEGKDEPEPAPSLPADQD
ncbi:signal peptidase II [Actinomadura sp. 21ATH]|uniref:signal peptidase II n=1 Tax=Actinomadura sp. 21ATH TaxID=1735444 RepID=UPI0035BF7403